MPNLLTRGLGKLQSLIKRGFGGEPVIVEAPSGSINRLFPKKSKYIKRKIIFNIDGRIAIKISLNKKMKGFLVFFEKALYNVIGRVKVHNISKYLVKAKNKIGILIKTLNITAKTKYTSAYNQFILGKSLYHNNSKYPVSSITALRRKSLRTINGTTKYSQRGSYISKGTSLHKSNQKNLISGTRNISKLLMTTGILKGIYSK